MWTSTIKRVKITAILNLIIFLHLKKYLTKSKCGVRIASAFTHQADRLAFHITAACGRACLRSERYQCEALHGVGQPHGTWRSEDNSCPAPDPELFVTDLSISLSLEEKQLHIISCQEEMDSYYMQVNWKFYAKLYTEKKFPVIFFNKWMIVLYLCSWALQFSFKNVFDIIVLWIDRKKPRSKFDSIILHTCWLALIGNLNVWKKVQD